MQKNHLGGNFDFFSNFECILENNQTLQKPHLLQSDNDLRGYQDTRNYMFQRPSFTLFGGTKSEKSQIFKNLHFFFEFYL